MKLFNAMKSLQTRSSNMAAILIIIILCHLVGSKRANESNMVPIDQIMKIIIDVQDHFGSKCVLLHSSLETGDIKLHLDLQKSLILSEHQIPMAVSLKIEGNNYKTGNSSFFGCHRPVCVLPLVYSSRDEELNAFHLITNEENGKQDAIWLYFHEPSKRLDDFLEGVDIPFDYEFLVAQRVEEAVSLTEVYRVREDFPLQMFHFGTWRPNVGLEATALGFHGRRNNLQGIVLKAVVAAEEPAVILNYEHNLEVSGYVVKLLEVVAQELNFTLNYIVQANGEWGNPYPNGSWNGMMGKIVYKQVDMGVNNFFFTTRRHEVLDFTIPTYYRQFKLFIKSLNEHNLKWTHFAKPFSRGLWMIISMAIILLGLFVVVLYRIWRHYHRDKENQWACQLTFYNSYFSIISLFLQQGNDMVCSGPGPCQLVFFTTLVTSMVLLAAYSGVLISFLAVDDIKVPFNDITELLADKSYKAGLFNIPAEFHRSKYNSTGMTDIHKLKRLFDADKNPPQSILEGLLRVCSSNYVFLIPVDAAKISVGQIPCQIEPVPNVGFRTCQAYPMRKHSPYRTAINHVLHKLKSNGVMMKELSNTHRWKIPEKMSVDIGVQLEDVTPVLVLLLAGITLAAALLAVEYVTHKLARQHRSQSRFKKKLLKIYPKSI